ncbi:hypothetical protein QBC43DRAFT_71375 [Cladorrhinum sp. PSN259]|nr:hypothetical protein QBC43DRAFT_71375 [Cladorrhinum sp. PSN259]
MSGLEPLAAFGLACNVFQAISFAGEVCSLSKAIFKNGEVPDSTAGLEVTFNTLTSVCDQIKSTAGSAQRQLTDNDRELLRIAQDCHSAARALKAEVDRSLRATSSAKGNALKSLIAGLKINAHSRTRQVEKLEKLVRRHQDALETRLLFNMCSQTDAANIQQEKGFNDLDSTLQSFIQAYAKGETKLAQLLTQEAESIKHHVTTEVGKLGATVIDMATHTRLLQSLKYLTMNERRNQITSPYGNTFEWMVTGEDPQDSDSQTGLNDSSDNNANKHLEDSRASVLEDQKEARESASHRFLSWIQSTEEPLFWISGKPGSGKSTLMKFLASSQQVIQNLPRKPTGETLVLSHFIWSAGQLMDRRIKGILCSLLRQLLDRAPHSLAWLIVERFPEIILKDSPSDWDEEELQRIFIYCLQRSPSTVFIFLDGLDEIDPSLHEGQTRLIQLVQNLGQQISSLKICVASRPEPMLEKAFGTSPMIRIHELTQLDIWTFTSGVYRERFRSEITATDAGLIAEVCRTAEGVFLWVALALRTLQHGLENGDDFTDLEKRLKALPADLELLYKAMWDRLGINKDIYRQDGATYINIVRNYSYDFLRMEPTVLDILLTTERSLCDELLSGEAETPERLEILALRGVELARRIEIRSVGFLEVSRNVNFSLLSGVKFVHRSAIDFLEDTEEGQQLLQFDRLPRQDRIFRSVEALIASSLFLTKVTTPFDVGMAAGYWFMRRPEICVDQIRFLSQPSRGAHISIEQTRLLYHTVERFFSPTPPSSLRLTTSKGCGLVNLWLDFLTVAVYKGLVDIVREPMRTLAISKSYRSHLVAASLSPVRYPLFGEGPDRNLEMTCQIFKDKLEVAHFLMKEPIDPHYRTIGPKDLFNAVFHSFRRRELNGKKRVLVLWPISPIEATIELLMETLTPVELAPLRAPVVSTLDQLLTLGVPYTHTVVFMMWLAVPGLDHFIPNIYRFNDFNSDFGTDILLVEATIGILLDILLGYGDEKMKHEAPISDLRNIIGAFRGPRHIHKLVFKTRLTGDENGILPHTKYYSATDSQIITLQAGIRKISWCHPKENTRRSRLELKLPGLAQVCQEMTKTEQCNKDELFTDWVARYRLWDSEGLSSVYRSLWPKQKQVPLTDVDVVSD